VIVLLRQVADDDLPIFFEHQRDPEGARMAAFPPRDRDAFMAHWSKILRDETNLTRTVVVDGNVAGNVGSWLERPERRLIGYWIGREYWGRGIATSALSAFLGEVGERPLFARVAEHNVASIRVLEKCGFAVTNDEDPPPDDFGDDVEERFMRLDA
jgi:RimJ/RimL family protein N-acetyltransferase